MFNKIKHLLLITLTFLLFSESIAQNIGINETGASPHQSAALDIDFTNKGVLLPRLSETQRDAINNPAESLIIFNITSQCYESYSTDDTQWYKVGCLEESDGGSGAYDDINFENCGDTFKDDRDDNTYKTVQIGNQCWFAENLNFNDYPNALSYCYNEDDAYCEVYGRLYVWNVAMNGSSSSDNNPSGIQGVCPNGWHIPSMDEWIELVNAIGNPAGAPLKALVFSGNNSSGFGALNGGNRMTNGAYANQGNWGYWWSATESSANNARYINLSGSTTNVTTTSNTSKNNGYSIRCVMD